MKFKKVVDNLYNYRESVQEVLEFIGYGSNEFFEIELALDYKWYVSSEELYFDYDGELYINTISSYSALGKKLYMNSDSEYTYIMNYNDFDGYELATIMIFDNLKKDESIVEEY